MTIELIQCAKCSTQFPDTVGKNRRECPNCGSTSRFSIADAESKLELEDRLDSKSIRIFYKRNPAVFCLVVVLTICAPFLGLFLAGWIGVLIGIVVGLVSVFLGPRAIERVWEIKGP